MGTDKACLPWRGEPLWKHQLRLAEQIGASEILISGKRDAPYSAVANVVTDEIQDCGPLAGLDALLAGMNSEWLVLVAVDMPLLNSRALKRLLTARGDSTGVVPMVSGRIEPLAAVYPCSIAQLVRERLRAQDGSVQSLVRAAEAAGFVRFMDWPEGESGCFRSLNTPQDFDAVSSES